MNTEPSGTGFATPFLTFKVSKVIEAAKRFGRGYKPRPASALPTRGTGFATPFLRFKISKGIEAAKRFGRGYKPRPALALSSANADACKIKLSHTRDGVCNPVLNV